LDDVTEILCAPRDQLLKVVPLAEPIGVADCCRIAYDDMDAMNKYLWFYGKVRAVDARGELIDVEFDNGEEALGIPTNGVCPVALVR
jgi:hypothetical protein